MNNIKTIEELVALIDKKCKFGWIDINGEKHYDKKNFETLYEKQEFSKILKTFVATNIEKTSLEIEFFKKHFIKYHAYHLTYQKEKHHPQNTTFIIYEENDAYNFIMHNIKESKIIALSKDKYNLNQVLNLILSKRYPAQTYELVKITSIPKRKLTFQEYLEVINQTKQKINLYRESYLLYTSQLSEEEKEQRRILLNINRKTLVVYSRKYALEYLNLSAEEYRQQIENIISEKIQNRMLKKSSVYEEIFQELLKLPKVEEKDKNDILNSKTAQQITNLLKENKSNSHLRGNILTYLKKRNLDENIKNQLEQELNEKLDLYIDYNRMTFRKERHEKYLQQLEENMIKIIDDFEKSPYYNLETYAATIGMKAGDIKKRIKKLDIKYSQRLNKIIISKREEEEIIILRKTKTLLYFLENGIEEEGTIRDVNILDIYLILGTNIKNIITILRKIHSNGNLSDEEYNIINKAMSINYQEGFKLSEEEFLEHETYYNQNLTYEDRIKLLDFFCYNNLPFRSKLVLLMKQKIIENQPILPKRKYYKKTF